MKEKRYRSLFKAISWRITGTIDTFLITLIVTGKFKFAIAVSGVEVFTKIFLFYLHERIWNRVNFGREKLDSSVAEVAVYVHTPVNTNQVR